MSVFWCSFLNAHEHDASELRPMALFSVKMTCELPSAYHPCGLLEVGASRVILHQPTFISHLLIGLSPFTFLEDGRLLSEKAKGSYFYFNNFSFSNLASSAMISSNFLLNDNVLSSVNPYSFTH